MQTAKKKLALVLFNMASSLPWMKFGDDYGADIWFPSALEISMSKVHVYRSYSTFF